MPEVVKNDFDGAVIKVDGLSLGFDAAVAQIEEVTPDGKQIVYTYEAPEGEE